MGNQMSGTHKYPFNLFVRLSRMRKSKRERFDE